VDLMGRQTSRRQDEKPRQPAARAARSFDADRPQARPGVLAEDPRSGNAAMCESACTPMKK